MSQARVRVPRSARAAVERARLTVVPPRKVRAPRMPFAVLVFGLLAAGVVGLLVFNTHMQQQSFYATSLQRQADALVAEKQSLSMELERLRDPQRVAARAKHLGMVAPSVPAFIRLSDRTVVGNPVAATPEDGVAIRSAPPPKPAVLNPPPLVITVKPDQKPDQNPGQRGAAGQEAPAGTNGAPSNRASEGARR